MHYCKRCLYPSTKPDIKFNEDGVCSACLNFDAREQIDWEYRGNDFKRIVKLNAKAFPDNGYDCIVPVSGGKDSTYQVVKCLQYGLRPLAVTAMTCALSEIGRRNLDNIGRLGVDHVMVQTNKKVRAKLNNYCLKTIGDISWPEHVLIFTAPIREAMLRGIHVIVYGENPQNEYGGPNSSANLSQSMNSQWLQEFGGLCGLRVSDIIDKGVATTEEMFQYTYPTPLDLACSGIEAVYMGQFFPWDGQANAEFAEGYGFKTLPVNVEGSHCSYENLDNYHTGIHDYFKYIKFGFGRATDIVCNRIRRGRITRDEGVQIVKSVDGVFPHTYLQKSLLGILEEINMPYDEFLKLCRKFANPKLFDTTSIFPRQLFEVK